MHSIFYNCASRWRCAKLNKSFNTRHKNVCCRQLHNEEIPTYSQESANGALEKTKFIPFLDRINLRRTESRRSILVEVRSSQSYKELFTYCNQIGTVKNMFHYSTGVEPLHFIVVEFSKESDTLNVLSSSSYNEEVQAVPTQSQFLWFRAGGKKLAKLKQSKTAKLSVENGTEILTESVIEDKLKACENVSEQMRVLYSITRLNDLGTRLRFLTARQMENMISGMFPHASVYPFGSSVNGYGKMGCDLDLVLRLVDNKEENKDSRLVFQCKADSGSERTMNQKHMETIGDLIHLFLPGCSQVRRILQARVPIIKYRQQLTNVECDLSMTNMSGVYMSDFLYIMGELDDRVRPLIFAIRKWAKEVSLTHTSPGTWLTNFSLTLLVLAFLQKPLRSPPILPTLNTLVKLAGPNDKYFTEDGTDCSFLRDLTKFKTKTKNTESLQSLLLEFFEYYSQFDFTSKAVCLNEAVVLTKPDFSPMYIINPLERGLNVSKNISLEQVVRFKKECGEAAWVLETEDTMTNCGLLSIFENKRKISNKFTKQSRLMEVVTLFEEENEGIKEPKEEFKNEQIKHEIRVIKKETKEKIKAMENHIKRQNSQR